MSEKLPKTAWLLNDGRAGHWRQVKALARYLPVETVAIHVPLKAPWSWFAPRSFPAGRAAHPDVIPPDSDPPNIIISCGRRTAAVARWFRREYESRPRIVQILDCGLNPASLDWVIAPSHDRLTGNNVLQTIGSLNPVDDEWLAQASAKPGAGDQRRAALLLGGSSRHFEFTQGWFETEFEWLAESLSTDGYVLDVIASRRTPEWAADLVSSHQPVRWIPWKDSEPQQAQMEYRNALAGSALLVVSADSVNMVSEACASGRPVFVMGARRITGKLTEFHRALHVGGYVHWLETGGLTVALAKPEPTACLRETEQVARKLIDRGVLG